MNLRPASRPARALVTLLGLLSAVAVAPAALADEPESWHAETLTTSPRGLHVTQYWSTDGDHLRAETVVAGHRLVTIVNGGVYYAIDATAGTALAIQRSDRAKKESKTRKRLVGLEGFVIRERGGEKVREERLGGRMCDVYRLTDAEGKREVWVEQGRQEEMLPLRVEIYNRQAGALIRTDYIQWATGLPLPDRFFEPDPRFTVIELGYEEFVAKSSAGEVPIPVLHANLLHGDR